MGGRGREGVLKIFVSVAYRLAGLVVRCPLRDKQNCL